MDTCLVIIDELQAQLKSGREELVRKACPALTDELIAAMKRAPMRGYDPSILKEPHIYRSGLITAFVFRYKFGLLTSVQAVAW